MIMLVFSFIFSSIFVMIHPYTNNRTSTKILFPSLPLHHLPEKLLPFCMNSIFIYTWFYNLLIHSSLYKSLSYFITRQQQPILPRLRSTPTPSFSYKYLYILLYILFNLGITSAVYYDNIHISSLCGLPTILGIAYLYNTSSNIPFSSYQHKLPYRIHLSSYLLLILIATP